MRALNDIKTKKEEKHTTLEEVGAVFIKVDETAVNVVDHLLGIDLGLLDGLLDLVVDHKLDRLNTSQLNMGRLCRVSILLTI